MTELDFSRCALPPFKHQREDVAALVEHPFFFIASEPRTGKSKIVIDAAQFLFERGVIDRVIVVAPAPVRDVWFSTPYGEIAKHHWPGLPTTVALYHSPVKAWALDAHPEGKGRRLDWVVTNYEFIRSKARLEHLLLFSGQRTLLILDESAFVKNYASTQTKACLQLRRACGRVVLLNGTPIFHSPLDLFSQSNILDASVLDCKHITLFRTRYAVLQPVLGKGGRPLDNGHGQPIKKIVGWRDLDDLQRRLAPHTVRRLQAECLDLPPKLDPVTLTATLTPETWAAYKSMRNDLVVWLSKQTVSVSASAAIRALRLSQITGGFIGGLEASAVVPIEEGLLESIKLPDSFLDGVKIQPEGAAAPQEQTIYSSWQPVGREKLDVLLWFIEQRLEIDPNLHLVAWCRFRAELSRMVEVVKERFPQFEVGAIQGGQKADVRAHALSLLKPETSPAGPVFVGGIEGTGSFGLDMCAAHTCVTVSSGYSPGRTTQTLDRVYGPNQTHPIAYYEIMAVGPRGQRTIDADILSMRRTGEDIATRTAAAWVKALSEE